MNTQTIFKAKTARESMDQEAAYLRSIGIPAKDGTLTLEEQKEEFVYRVRDAVLKALDGIMEAEHAKFKGRKLKGWTDQDLPALFKAVDKHAQTLFDRIVS